LQLVELFHLDPLSGAPQGGAVKVVTDSGCMESALKADPEF